MSATVTPVPPAAADRAAVPAFEGDPIAPDELRRSTPSPSSVDTLSGPGRPVQPSLLGLARRTLGISLLLVTVVLWTTSNFLASNIFADNTYSKPYFVTYINTSFFSVSLVVILIRRLYATNGSINRVWRGSNESSSYTPITSEEEPAYLKPDGHDKFLRGRNSGSGRGLFGDQVAGSEASEPAHPDGTEAALDVRETAKLSLEFCMLWFAANYFAAACLHFTSVASATILTSTSSIWTLLFGAMIGGERFTLKKLLGVLASLAGVILISSVDLSGSNDKNRGSFPHKSQGQIAIGDAFALGSAVFYGVYTILMKIRMGDEARVNMPLFFGFVGVFNVLMLWPGFFVLHFMGVETFELPPTKRILAIVLLNSVTSLISDFCWAYAMLLTSPLVVTVGLSLTIPLSIIGQMILNSQNSSLAYWFGAAVVFSSFIFITYESNEEDEDTRR
ncbi:MAG: vacuolar membrane [Lasallia pustulata]|uniref:Vacuolar membrane n=1 Tax=Lasallia pustulata TaxID=136370 RepID=A0A5M8PIQ1_9LECA|nr:MAG: vacuolar membrane [Lasallia pustulata]